jgi:sec-independent protein translocase protein TatB
MFDVGWSEMAVIALVTLIVIGPKELPRVLRTVGQWIRKAQSLAREFQRGLDDMVREADLEDAKKLLDGGRSLANPKKLVMDTLDPTGSIEDEARELQTAVIAEAPDGEAAQQSEPQTPAAPAQAAKSDTAAKPAKEEAAQAKIVKQPVNIAPPHSLTPPAEPGAETTAKQPKTKAAGPNGSQKSA